MHFSLTHASGGCRGVVGRVESTDRMCDEDLVFSLMGLSTLQLFRTNSIYVYSA